MVMPVGCRRMVDLSSLFIEDCLRITMRTHRPIDCLPDIELLAGAAVVTKRGLVRDVVTDCDQSMAEIVAHRWLLNAFMGTLQKEYVRLVIEIGCHVGVEVNRI